MNMKVCNGWVDGNTLPPGLNIYQQSGKAVSSMNLVSYIQAHIHDVSTTGGPIWYCFLLLQVKPSIQCLPFLILIIQQMVSTFGKF